MDGTVKCWGENNDGELGDGTYDDQTTPVEVSGITTATSIALGYDYSCAVLTDGEVMCYFPQRFVAGLYSDSAVFCFVCSIGCFDEASLEFSSSVNLV